ncbi:uncharacterized protein LOC121780095 isoform X3 [Salvia splendens]|uniref:uncharacterized protein LOC121780095 isoform X3 n=1 Tax=Salvia splendens TaxID=180675 RepID=UPI001C2571A7|nr:uncharacterized protein LOC121780095 isoform X3 [Salvia splendens]
MAAYGAMVSLMHIIDTLDKHPSPPISINEKQVQSLTQNITFLQEFLDCYISPFADSHDADPLERRIADAVYAAEDVIESHIVDQIQSGSTIVADHEFYHNLRKVIEEMDLINKDVKSIAVEAQTKQKPVAALSASSLTVKESVIVGSDEVFLEVLDKLAGNQLNLQIIPITGMGGIGLSSILPNPPSDDSDIVIMENLQTLKGVEALLLNGEVVKRIPNVKKLDLKYYLDKKEGENCLSYLQCFSKLESLRCITCYQSGDFWMRINFPNSIKKLVVQDFYSTEFGAKLEDILPKIGSLPLLEKLVLDSGVFRTSKWETIEGQFQNLKFLELSDCEGLVNWIVSDSSHFPLLQKLCLYYLYELEEIPSEVGEIATLKSISLYRCSEAVVASAKKIVEEREDLYGEQLHLLVDVA